METKRRDFVAAGLGLSIMVANSGCAQDSRSNQKTAQAATQSARDSGIRHRKAKTTVLFKSPGMYPNGLAVAPEGLWIAQQKISVQQAAQWKLPVPEDRDEAAWLVDWNGKLLKTIITKSRNTSGMAYGDGCVWMGANTDPQGIFQTDMNSRTVSHRQIPLGPANNGGGCHGAQWHEGKLWIVANRLSGLLRVDPKSWQPEFMIPIYRTTEMSRWHDMTFDNEGFIWQITGNNSTSYAEGRPSLVKYDANTGQVVEIVDFVPGSADPHNLEFHDGALISCDAGVHPGWKPNESPFSGAIFRIELI